MKNKLNLIILTLTIFFAVTSCCCRKKMASTSASTSPTAVGVSYEKDGYVKATVIKYTVDGCNYLLQLESGKKLEPLNLSTDLKKEGQVLWIKYTTETKAASICMAGEMVNLTDVKAVN